MLFDTHTHVNFAAFKDDADETVKRALENQTWMINVGTQTDTSQSAAELAKKYSSGVFAAVGLHPVHVYQQMLDEEESHFKSRAESFDDTVYEAMLSDKVVAVGECGLDYYRLPAEGRDAVISKQKTEFIKQLHFAKKHKLPVIIHCREAYEDLLDILRNEYKGGPGVAHSFTDTWYTAKRFLDLGFYVALNGILTFDKTDKLAEVVRNAPMGRLLTETDAPYLTPPPYRGKRNEPSYVKYVVAKIAEIKKISLEKAGDETFVNARKLFKIKKP
ncbi:MAG: TatD family hydrolase [Candidatus Doudnabacteria bacterium]|nr:TatD family hydrolase [Candidatus Doudnabacteria bacterium]